MENLQNAGNGIKMMFIASVGAVICTVLGYIPGINFLAALAAIGFGIASLVGLYNAGKDISGCRTAFGLTIANMVVSIIKNGVGDVVGSVIITIIGAILSVMTSYYVCTSIAETLEYMDVPVVARNGYTVWKINLACYIILICVVILILISGSASIALIGGVAVTILSLIASILYMVFLYQSYQEFGA